MACVLPAACARPAKPGVSPSAVDEPSAVVDRWVHAPPLDGEGFWKREDLLVSGPVNGQFQVALMRLFSESMHVLEAFSFKEYQAIPLEAWLATRPAKEIGRGNHLLVTNIRGEAIHLTREDVIRHKPVIVIGIDGERNLYRIATSYRLAREYSWRRTAAPPAMIRPLGPFLFFPDGPPPHLDDTSHAVFGLLPDGFRWSVEDPFAFTAALTPELHAALVGGDGCLKCHAFHGAGARAHHVRARDGGPHGGFALPLDEYPKEVLRRFLFEQDKVAEGFGVEPLRLDRPTAQAIYDLVTGPR